MGTGYKIQCDNCNYSDKFMLGVGMMPLIYDMALSNLHYNKKKEMLRLLEDKEVLSYEFSYELFRCLDCSNLTSKPVLSVLTNTNETFKTSYHCRKCRNDEKKLELTGDTNIEEMPCPRCKIKKLRKENIIS